MAQKFYKDELVNLKIKGQIKPFIDQKLQIQIPFTDTVKDKSSISNRIFSHYSSFENLLSYYILPTDQKELEKAMNEARTSFETWKKLKEKIHKAIIERISKS